jgi:hypothetical protein
MELTGGQPWLVNSLAREVTYKMKANRDRSIEITTEMLLEAKENLIQERQTHLDQIVDKLKEERVRSVILPMILGDQEERNDDDVQYCTDLGLVTRDRSGLRISNKIYQEIVPRVLTNDMQLDFIHEYRNETIWLNKDGSINVNSLLTLFKDFWSINAGIWGSRMKGYKQAAPQLVMQAFMQRVINGGGTIEREYALASRRTDLFIKWKYLTPSSQLHIQNIVIEIKVINKSQKYDTIKREAIVQTADYAKICGVDNAHILIFDRDGSRDWGGEATNEYAEHDGVKLEIWKLGENKEEY